MPDFTLNIALFAGRRLIPFDEHTDDVPDGAYHCSSLSKKVSSNNRLPVKGDLIIAANFVEFVVAQVYWCLDDELTADSVYATPSDYSTFDSKVIKCLLREGFKPD